MILPQIEFGTKITSYVTQPTFVFASLWPSWLYAAKASGYVNLVVHIEDVKPGVKEMVQAGLPEGECLVEWRQWKTLVEKEILRQGTEPVLVLFQGPRDALNRVLSFLNNLHKGPQNVQILAFPTSEGSSRRVAKRQRQFRRSMSVAPVTIITHSMVGGVIDHAWTLESNVPDFAQSISCLERKSRVQAVLADYLDSKQSGRVIEGVQNNGKREPMKVVWKVRTFSVETRSVFSVTGWVRRPIANEELMDVYDVGVGDRKLMLKALSQAGYDNLPLEFTQQVPVRVLLRCLQVFKSIQSKNGPSFKHEGQKEALDDETTSGDLETELLKHLEKNVWSTTNLGVSDEDKRHSKNDDATAQVSNWNRRICERLDCEYQAEIHDAALDRIRKLELRWYRSYRGGVIRSFRKYMHMEYGNEWLHKVHDFYRCRKQKNRESVNEELIKDYEVGMDAISRALAASFWEWDDGSTVFFWRWTKEHRKELRDGLKVWFRKSELPSYWGRQRWPEDRLQREQLQEKILKVVRRRYVSNGFVKSLTSFFAVPKGVGDIRVVYDGTRSGLNDSIWAPNFYLPTIASVLHKSDDKTFYGDIDIGEMFLNYFLDPDLRPWAGVDLSDVSSAIHPSSRATNRTILRWDRSLMGVRSSPFNCVRAYLISEEIIKGDRKARNNPFRWDRVIFNLPGTVKYDPSRPWMYRWDDIDQEIAPFVLSYVDDLRTGSSKGKQDCERITHVAGSKLNYLGEQDATRKRGEASQEPGAWAGSVIVSKEGEGLYVSISQEKWDKVKRIVDDYDKIIDNARKRGVPVRVKFKQLEKDTGFLVHVFMTYELLRPYLKGFYLTMNSWRNDRDKDGWKYGKREWEEMAEEFWQNGERWEEMVADNKCASAQDEVQSVPRFEEDIKVLKLMFRSQTPSRRLIRGFEVANVVYGFGDASGAGFGSSWIAGKVEANQHGRVHYRFGRWGSESEGESSNFRELRNLVDTLALLAKQGELLGVEVFVFTDNSTAEAAFSRGSSSNRKLYEMVKQVKLMEMLSSTRIHIIHVAGKRMIAQGTDGLSRGCLTDGVMLGKEMTSFVPLHLSALDRSQTLLPWLQYGSGDGVEYKLDLLSPEDWYDRGHDIAGGTPNCDGVWTPTYRYGNFVWAPPPCVADQCLEELRRARHKRQRSTLIFVCPKIMSYAWQRQLFRSADVVLQIPAGHVAWEETQYESLLIGFYFPFLQYEPWQLKNSNTLLGMARRLQRMCKVDTGASGLVLRELWQFTRKLQTLPECVVQRMLQGTGHHSIPKTATRK
jgi:hypothetical protein